MEMYKFSAIKGVYEAALNDISSIITYATAIAGIGALIYLCAKIWKEWANGGSIDFYGLLRPFAILLVLLNFSIVPTFLDTLTSPLETVTKELREKKNNEYNDKSKKLVELQYNRAKETVNAVKQDTGSGLRGIYKKVCQIANVVEYLNPGNQGMYWIRQATSFMISTLVEYLANAISYCILIFAYLTKVILVLIGPMVFALSIYPGFSGIFKQWFCRYINVCLWIPICNIIGYMMQAILISTNLDTAIKAAEDGSTLIGQNLALGTNETTSTILLLISIFLYAMVPKIADWIISGNGSGMFADAIGSAATKTASIATGAIGGKIAMSKLASKLGK